MTTAHESPKLIQIDPEILDLVWDDVVTSDFDDFRKEELAFMGATSRPLVDLVINSFAKGIQSREGGHDWAHMLMTGHLVGHRVLRKCADNMPSVTEASIIGLTTVVDEVTADIYQRGGDPTKTPIDVLFERTFSASDMLIDFCGRFRSETTRAGAQCMFMLFEPFIADK